MDKYPSLIKQIIYNLHYSLTLKIIVSAFFYFK